MSLPSTYKLIKTTSTGEPSIAEKPLPTPSTNQVLVKIEFAPINPTDLIRMKGFYNNGIIPQGEEAYNNGFEGSGIIVAVGDNLTSPHKVGDRVHVRGGGCFAQYLLTSSELCSPILQDDLSLEDAASHFVNPATVYYMGLLAEQEGHKAAIHTTGSSAIGRMLIRLFKHKGIKLINIVRKDEFIEELNKEGADYVLNSQSPDFETKLKELAEKEGATLAFDAICGDFPSKVLRAQPPKSVCYIYGLLAGENITELTVKELFQWKSLRAFNLVHDIEEMTKKGEIEKFVTEVHALLPTVFKTHVQKIFKLEEIKDAIAYYEQNSSKGKILLKPN